MITLDLLWILGSDKQMWRMLSIFKKKMSYVETNAIFIIRILKNLPHQTSNIK